MTEGVVQGGTAIEQGISAKPDSPTRRTIRRFLRHRLALAGVVTVIIIIILALIGDEEAAYEVNLTMGSTNQPPSEEHPLGTDALGRDVLARTMVGGRVSLFVAFVSVAIAAFIGTTIGVISGYAGGRIDGDAHAHRRHGPELPYDPHPRRHVGARRARARHARLHHRLPSRGRAGPASCADRRWPYGTPRSSRLHASSVCPAVA